MSNSKKVRRCLGLKSVRNRGTQARKMIDHKDSRIQKSSEDTLLVIQAKGLLRI